MRMCEMRNKGYKLQMRIGQDPTVVLVNTSDHKFTWKFCTYHSLHKLLLHLLNMLFASNIL